MNEPIITAEQICFEPQEGVVTIASDPSIFETYSLKDQKRVFGCLKRVKPHPEFKVDFDWTISFMRETIQAAVEDNITQATNAIELGEAVMSGLDTLAEISDEPGTDSLDDLVDVIEADPDAGPFDSVGAIIDSITSPAQFADSFTEVTGPAPTATGQKIVAEVFVQEVNTKIERLNTILKLRAEGLSLKQIGDKVGLSGPRVSGILRSL